MTQRAQRTKQLRYPGLVRRVLRVVVINTCSGMNAEGLLVAFCVAGQSRLSLLRRRRRGQVMRDGGADSIAHQAEVVFYGGVEGFARHGQRFAAVAAVAADVV